MSKKKKESQIVNTAIEQFSKNGFFSTSVSQIASSLKISVGNIYTYFKSKNELAKTSVTYVTNILANKLNEINSQNISTKEKIYLFVESYLKFLQKHPAKINFFFKVYLSNREIFCDDEHCGFELAQNFINEVKSLIDSGIEEGEFGKRDFYLSFAIFTGILGGITFLNGENVLSKDLSIYTKDLSEAIYRALQ